MSLLQAVAGKNIFVNPITADLAQIRASCSTATSVFLGHSTLSLYSIFLLILNIWIQYLCIQDFKQMDCRLANTNKTIMAAAITVVTTNQ